MESIKKFMIPKEEEVKQMSKRDTNVNYKQTFKRLFTYFNNYKLYFFGGVFLNAIGSVAVIAFHSTLSPLVDMLITKYELSSFVHYIYIMALIAAFITITHYLSLYLLGHLAENVVYQIRSDLFSHIQKLPMSFFDTHSYGEIMSTLTNDVATLNTALEESISQVVNSIVTIIGTFIMMVLLSVPLTIIIVVMMISILFLIKFISVKSAKSFRNQQAELGSMNGYIVEMMSGQKVIKVFNREEDTMSEFNERNEQLRDSSTRATIFGIMVNPIIGSLSYAAYAIVAVMGGYFVVMGSLSVGNIAAYLQFTRSFFNPVTQVSNQMNTLFTALAGAERIFNLLDEEIEVDAGRTTLVENKGLKYWKSNDGMLTPLNGGITFEHVDFSYVEGHDILKDIDLYAKPGQKIAFVGSTGAGKTTITNLINRFYEVNDGKILFDGIDIKDINKFDLRSTLSMVLQDVNLFEGTIKENIRYGRLDASDEEVIEAAKLANADYFISKLPDGYDTMLSVNGENLSRGERQLLSIARAAIANPSILILDEATSSVDTRTEKLIAEGMDKLMKDRTTFVIAHRLSTVRDSNAIMVLEQGKIIERGSHEDLLNIKGRYYDLNVGACELN